MPQHALYYDEKLLGIITNPEAYPGGIDELCYRLSPNEGACDTVEIPDTKEMTFEE